MVFGMCRCGKIRFHSAIYRVSQRVFLPLTSLFVAMDTKNTTVRISAAQRRACLLDFSTFRLGERAPFNKGAAEFTFAAAAAAASPWEDLHLPSDPLPHRHRHHNAFQENPALFPRNNSAFTVLQTCLTSGSTRKEPEFTSGIMQTV